MNTLPQSNALPESDVLPQREAGGLRLAENVRLPYLGKQSVFTERMGVFGQSGSGKTYLARKLNEGMLTLGGQTVTLDPTGAYWGLRATGETDSAATPLPVYILGGRHADAPLDPRAGQTIADVIVDEGLSLVLDMSLWDDEEKVSFARDLALRLFLRNEKPLHLFVDEADVFAPQEPGSKLEWACRRAFDRIIRQGRIQGFGVTLLCQRPQAVSKNLLSQAATVFVLRLSDATDRAAIEGRFKAFGEGEQRKEIMASLASLAPGDTWMWSPHLGRIERFHVERTATFDSSATPEVGVVAAAPKYLAPPDLSALRDRLHTAIEEAEANDPAALKRQIAALQKQLREKGKGGTNTVEVEKIVTVEKVVEKRVEVPVISGEALATLTQLTEAIPGVGKDLMNLLGVLSSLAERVKAGEIETVVADRAIADVAPVVKADKMTAPQAMETRDHSSAELEAAQAEEAAEDTLSATKAKPATRVKRRRTASGTAVSAPAVTDGLSVTKINLASGARRILEAFRGHREVRLTRAQIGTRAGLKWRSSGTFDTYLNAHLREGRIKDAVGRGNGGKGYYQITEAGLQALGLDPATGATAPQTTAEMLEQWRPALGNRAFEMLGLLVAVYPSALSASDLAERMGLTPGAGTLSGYIGELKQSGLANKSGQGLAVAEELFPETAKI